MKEPISRVIIVGGGTAGWITAGVIGKKLLANANNNICVSLIESGNVPTIGVGEGTWPTIRNTLKKIGISENDLIRECDASFKQGVKFAKWATGKDEDFYYHPFNATQGYPKIDLAPYWLTQKQYIEPSFSNSTAWQEHLCQLGLAPKYLSSPEYADVANYSYHIDAAKLATTLKQHCVVKLGVKHIVDTVISVKQDNASYIKSVTTEQNGEIKGDLFIDCTGLASLLLGETMNVPFIDKSDVLFINRAITMHVPYDNEDSPIATHTISTAQEAGWIWDIGLSSRRGIGHVYSNEHSSDELAEQQLRQYVGKKEADLSSKIIKFTNGHRADFWVKNCVGVGLSSGFLEPLEATSIMLVEISATMIAEQFPANKDIMAITAKRFNKAFHYRWHGIIDFLKLHYALSQRTEPFWQDNRMSESIPESLQELIQLWAYQAPSDYDFSSKYELFQSPSYQYVLYGMGFKTDYSKLAHTLDKQALAERQFELNKLAKEKLASSLPSHRELINNVKKFGFQAI